MPHATHPLLRRLQRLLPRTPRSWLAWSGAPLALAASLVAMGTGSPPDIPQITLAQEPLYAAVTVDKPTISLALSVEYPTVGAQYVTSTAIDNTYSTANEYLGYYDAESCYAYNDAPSETIPSGMTTADYKRFDRTGAATSRKCADGFSGNFLNWASSSAIDMLRLSLSGGDRYIDTASLTVLQRAVLPNGDPVCMWNSSNFPAKQLNRSSGTANDYAGAVPQSMITQANGSDIWVANTLNRIYFGTSRTGGCGDTGAYTLGARQSSLGPITSGLLLPLNAVRCVAEGGNCTSTGIQEIWYGALTSWRRAPLSGTTPCTNAVFGDPLQGVGKACYLVPYTGTWQPPSAGALNSDGFFYSRVQVCNSSGGTLQDSRDYGLCRQYPNGNFKPTGAIQKYSDQMRLAAFGYLMDQSASYDNNNTGRYGGVLRAPMKYVGAKTFNASGQDNTPTSGNAKAEWNASTGVFNPNPEGDAMQISGVINYLNKFGRTGPVQGRYKKYDPVGEMYYQSLRYLQGLQPTPDAIAGNALGQLTDEWKDGYPVYTTWTDPYGDGRSDSADYSCLKSNIVVIGDINTHDGNWRNIPTTDNKAANVPNFRTWHSLVQSFERNQAVSYIDGQGATRTSGNPNGANNSVPSSSQTSQIMGYAYWAHTHDIRGADWTTNAGDKRRPGLRVKTFLFDVNENGAQNNDDTRRFANQFFMAAKYGGFESDASNSGARPYNAWGNPFKRQDGTNDNNVWQKQATPGEASTYYLQSNARGVLNAFEEIFSRAATSARSISAPAIPSNDVTSTSGAVAYSAKFDTSNWSGDVVAETITVSSSDQLSISSPSWSASDRLTNMTSPATNRKIFVGSGSATSNPVATTFTWGAINATLKGQLNKSSPTATADSRGEQRLNYLRGDRSQEGSPFRVRSSLLGDIVNSNVVYSGAPSLAYSGTGYAAFRTSYDTRTKAVFAGANDGMLHAFNASNGDELFAYVPSWLGPRLSALTDPSFTNNHQSYVDAPLEVGEAQVAFTDAASDWKTVLVGGTGAGGSGVFALDVSNPGSFAASNVMWEFTRADDSDMGQVIGQPRLIKLKVSNATATRAATYRWFAAVGSGVNNYVPETTGGPYSATGNPALFLLALDKAAGAAWAQGTNYYKITLPANSDLSATRGTGVANFSALYGASGEVTDIFAGDLHGSVWKLSFKDLAPGDWTINNLSFFKNGNNAIPMYMARDGSSPAKAQPITAAPALFTGPVVGGKETFYVVIATGKYLEAADVRSTDTNSLYALFDNGSATADSSSPTTGAISGRGRLIAGTVSTTTTPPSVSVGSFRWGRPTSDTDANMRSGWYFDLPSSGERAVSRIADFGSLYASFNSLIPSSASATAGSCNNNQGSGNAYVFNVATGAVKYTVSTVGVLGPAMSIIKQEDTNVSVSDSTGRRVRTIQARSMNLGQSGIAQGQTSAVQQIVGRLSWRQIFDYQERKSN